MDYCLVQKGVRRLPLLRAAKVLQRAKCTVGVTLLTIGLAVIPQPTTAEDAQGIHRHLISSIGSERATSGSGNKIVTFDGKTHVVWQDATDDGSYLNRVRSLDHATGRWTEPFTLNQGRDNHARPILSVDRQGYLHAILSGHNSPVTSAGPSGRATRLRGPIRSQPDREPIRSWFAAPMVRYT